MKAKRIVSILLTGSMLLSLLPVSALAAAPVFDAPAQTTAKKAAPLVQEADASRSRRDLDAENGTAENITTIHLNAEGIPASADGTGRWDHNASSKRLNLNEGTFTLQPSSDSGAVSALQENLYIYKDAEFNGGTVGNITFNNGTISGGTFQKAVYNEAALNHQGLILDGIFQGTVYNSCTISNGNFQEKMYNSGTISGGIFQEKMYNSGTISGGIFKSTVTVDAISQPAQINGGTFEDGMEIHPDGYYPTIITDGLFTKAVDVSSITNPSNLQITGGYFVSEPTLPEGSDTTFATVSDQAGRTFQVPVNGDWSENGYEALYVPHGMSEQPNTITVKTDTALIDCLADGETIMGTDKVRLNNDGSCTIEVYQPQSIVLVTAEPTPGGSGGELDPGLSSGTAALGVVLATAGFGSGASYLIGTNLWLNAIYDFVPTNRIQLAVALWNKADCPAPVSTELYPDIDADDTDAQAAARWCVEQGLMKDYHETDKDGNEEVTFKPYRYMFRPQAIKAWYDLETLLNEQQ